MTLKKYDANPDMRDFSATVVSCGMRGEVCEAVLDQTCFFPEGGGQLSDRGILRVVRADAVEDTAQDAGMTLRVTDVQTRDGEIFHVIVADGTDDQNDPEAVMRLLSPGQTVRGEVDAAHRFDQMQQHTAEHIFSGLVHRIYGYDNVGFRLSEHSCTMDYNGVLDDAQAADLEYRVNEVIWRDLPVTVSYPTEEEQAQLNFRSKKEIEGDALRIVTIEGVDVCACCAPHVHRTGEIGLAKILRLQNWKGGVRLHIACGARALAQFVTEHDMVTALARTLSTSAENIPDRFRRMREEIAAMKKEMKALRKSEA